MHFSFLTKVYQLYQCRDSATSTLVKIDVTVRIRLPGSAKNSLDNTQHPRNKRPAEQKIQDSHPDFPSIKLVDAETAQEGGHKYIGNLVHPFTGVKLFQTNVRIGHGIHRPSQAAFRAEASALDKFSPAFLTIRHEKTSFLVK